MTIRRIFPALFASAVLTSSLAAGRAEAQSKSEFSTVRFYPAIGAGNYIGLEGAEVGKHKQASYGVMFDYSANTLEVERPCDGIRNVAGGCVNKETAFVSKTGLLHLMASYTIKGRTLIAFDLPLGFTDSNLFDTRIMAGGGNPTLAIQPQEGFAFADARLSAKTHIWSTANNQLRFSATVFTTLPTGMITSNGDCDERRGCSYLGERGVQAGGHAIAEFARGDFRAAVNVGGAYRPNRDFLTLETGSEIRYGAAGMYSITPLVHGKLEVAGASSIRAKDHPLEVRAMMGFGDDFVFNVGAGAGIVGDVGNPTYRIFAGAQWTPVTRDRDGDGIDDRYDACPNEPEDRDGHMDSDGCPDPDNDGDGVPDAQDKCPNEPEDLDGHEDEDGCPDPDNDGDGVPDGYDSCEGEMEDIDGDRDDDGCPDLDADFDGIDDDKDQCPNEPEDHDGLADDDGCPEDDFDGDGILDTVDACPAEAETWNGLLDEDGCPEDDEDADGVPDQLDQCPGQAETLNGKADQDGCPDGARLMVLQGQVLLPTATASFEGNVLRGSSLLVDAVTDYIKRNHQRGSVHVVVVAPADDTRAAARAAELAASLQRRSNRTVTSAHFPGSPMRVEFELVPPGLKALPRALPPAPPAPAAPPAPPAEPAAPAPAPAEPAKP